MENTDRLNEIIEPKAEETIPVTEPESVESLTSPVDTVVDDNQEIIQLLEQLIVELEEQTLKIELLETDDNIQLSQLNTLQAIVENTQPVQIEEQPISDEFVEREALELYSDISIIMISFLVVIIMMYKLIQSVFNTLTRHII